MLGAGFHGGVSLFIGTNENLGWGHTLNYPDLSDVYKLAMHPDRKHTYRLDGEWLPLEPYPIRLKVKLGFLRIPVRRKLFKSKYGVTFKTKDGFYAFDSLPTVTYGLRSNGTGWGKPGI